MTKKRAYTSQFGNQMVTAAQIGKRRNLEFNGQPTGEDYFSTHPPGKRKPVKHVMKGKWFFAYIEGGDRASNIDGGESLQHILFKEALCSLECVTLSLYKPTTGDPKKWHEEQITITHAETEKAIHRPGLPHFYADVYIEFSAIGPLGLKWEGFLYMEVFHKHAVGAGKQKELRELDVPVIEVEIPSDLSLNFDEEDTNDDRENTYRQFVKRKLEDENQPLVGVVLSDPSSKAFLEHLANRLKRKIQELELSKASLAEKLTSAEARVEETSVSLASERQKSQLANKKVSELTGQMKKSEDECKKALAENEVAQSRVAGLIKLVWCLAFALLAYVGISTFLGAK